MNISFNAYVITIIKEGVKDQFKELKEKAINEIYHELFINDD